MGNESEKMAHDHTALTFEFGVSAHAAEFIQPANISLVQLQKAIVSFRLSFIGLCKSLTISQTRKFSSLRLLFCLERCQIDAQFCGVHVP